MRRIIIKRKNMDSKQILFKKIISICVNLVALSFIASGLYCAKNPVYFFKSVTVQPMDTISHLLELKNEKYLDIEPLIKSISYKGGYLSTILPEEKYKKTMIEGYGECSNFSFGLAYLLSLNSYNYLVVHFLETDVFFNGGHVAIETSYQLNGENHIGIIDVVEGGVPASSAKLLGVRDLIQNTPEDMSIVSLNPEKNETSGFYTKDFLDNAVFGVMVSKEVEAYFDFLTNSYIPLGNEMIEKYFYLILSVLIDKYPTIYVEKDDYERVFKDHYSTKNVSHFVLWGLRISIIIAPFVFVNFILFGLKKLKRK